MEIIELKKFQQEQYDKFKTKRYCYLSWGTGVGKTFPFLKFIIDNPNEKFLILAPKSVAGQWAKYLDRFGIKYNTYGNENEPETNVLVAGLELFTTRNKIVQSRNKKEYYQYQKDLLVLQMKYKEYNLIIDEAHKIKAPTSQIAQILKKFFFKRYAFLTATPIEVGAWDNFIYFFLNIHFDWENFVKPRSFTHFKEQYCLTNKWGGIIHLNKELTTFFASQWDKQEHETDWVKEHFFTVPINDNIKSYLKHCEGDFDNHIKKRQVINGFAYIKIGKRNECLIFSEPEKLKLLESFLMLSTCKFVIFYCFEKEKEELATIKGGMEYKNIKSIDEFERNDKRFLYAHYASLNAGVRISFIDDIMLYTISMSNTAKSQSIGRGEFSERNKTLNVYSFIVDSKLEGDIIENNAEKAKRFREFLNGEE